MNQGGHEPRSTNLNWANLALGRAPAGALAAMITIDQERVKVARVKKYLDHRCCEQRLVNIRGRVP